MNCNSSSRDKMAKRVHNVVKHLCAKARIYTNPEGLIHHAVAGSEITYYTIVETGIGRLTDQVAAEQLAGADLSSIQKLNERVTREWSCLPQQKRKSKPTGIGIRSCFGEDEVILKVLILVLESRLQMRKVLLSRRNECRQFLQLRDAHGSLHVSGFEIIAHVGVNIFVVVPMG